MESSVEHVLERVNGNGLQALAEDGDEAQLTFTSTTPLEPGDPNTDLPPSRTGDEE